MENNRPKKDRLAVFPPRKLSDFSISENNQKNVVGIAKHNLFESTICPKFIISDVRCSGREKKLKKCAYKVEYASCSDIQRAAGVVCNDPIARKLRILLTDSKFFSSVH